MRSECLAGEQGSSWLGGMRLELQVAGKRISKFAIVFLLRHFAYSASWLDEIEEAVSLYYGDISMCLFGAIITQKL